MNKRVPIIGLVVVLIALAIIFVRRGGDDSVNPEPTASTVATIAPSAASTTESSASPIAASSTITITSTGFSPATITVKSGTTVTFKNESNSSVWPASNPHPTHTILRSFDADKGLKNGETYSYTFTTSGTFNYHDHLNPSLSGKVIVE